MANKPITGLSTQEAQRRAKEGRANVMPKSREGGVGEILSRNVLTLFNLLNLLLALVLLSVGNHRDMLFMGVVFSNVLIGTVQELRAKRTHDRLKLLSEGKVKTLRDGAVQELAPHMLVEGDVVLLSRGDQVPGDGVALAGAAHADESILTGESLAIAKQIGDTLYSGSFLADGRLTVELTAVGAKSYMGKLQMSARTVKRSGSVLMGDMKRIIRGVSIVIVPIGLLLYLKQVYSVGLSHDESVVKAVAAMVGMIPEGLMLLTSVSLAAGVVTLGRKKTLVNELYGIESLARTDIICMDKTGTLTSGDMALNRCIPAAGITAEHAEACIRALLGALGTDGATAAAIARAYPPDTAVRALEVVPFSSERKWSLARLETLGSLVLGAPERLLARDGLKAAQDLAAQGLRVVALMRGDSAPTYANGEPCLPQGLRQVALFCLEDALRPQVKETVSYFHRQGVTLKVLSGDSPLTVSAVARAAGLPNGDKLIDLSLIEGEKDYAALSREYTVFGRVSPEDKQELVRAMQADGHSVAMMGDGVNDIPALKAANCSIAMAGGSDAASRVAQMTLLGGGFDAMPSILLEGRRVINNITRASALFLVKNIYSMLTSLMMLALPFPYPFSPIQLTLVSGLTIGAPSLALALQPSKERVQGSFLRNVIMRAVPGGVCMALLVFAVMMLAGPLGMSDEQASTLCTLLAGFSGLTVLTLTCLPLTPLRAVVVALMAGLFTLGVLFFPSVFYLTRLSESMVWALIALCALTIPVQIGLGALVRRFRRPAARETFSA